MLNSNTKLINHKISGHNFHGRYSITIRGPANGFILSKKQLYLLSKAICPFNNCTCGGGYGDGPDSYSASTEQVDFDKIRLIPAK